MRVIWDYLSKADQKYLLSQIPLVDLFRELHLRAQQLDEEEQAEEEGEEFKLKTPSETLLVYRRLVSRYPHEVTRLIGEGLLKVPLWLQNEILERRAKGG